MRKHIEIYTDGSCFGNPGVGGWAAILVQDGTQKEISGGKDATTNNEMEITAVLEALKLVESPSNITIYSDSKYVCNTINLGWAKSWRRHNWNKSDGGKAQHSKLWSQILDLIEPHDVKFVWVKGHDGNKYNEKCDSLAVAESQKRAELLKKVEVVTPNKVYVLYYDPNCIECEFEDLVDQLRFIIPDDANCIFLPKTLEFKELDVDELKLIKKTIDDTLSERN